MNLDKKNVFTLQTAPGYTAFTEYFDAVGYEPYLNDDKTDCITENLMFSVAMWSLTAKRHHP